MRSNLSGLGVARAGCTDTLRHRRATGAWGRVMLELRADPRARNAVVAGGARAVSGDVVVAITTLFGAEFLRAVPPVILWQLPQIGLLTGPLQLGACVVPFAMPFAVPPLVAR